MSFAPIPPAVFLTEEKTRATAARNEKRMSIIEDHVSQGLEGLERRKSQLKTKINNGVERRKSQINSVKKAGRERVDKGVGKMGAKVNTVKAKLETRKSKFSENFDRKKAAFQERKKKVEVKLKKGKDVVGKKFHDGINWFFAVGTTEDENGRVNRNPPEYAPSRKKSAARKKSIKTVRFER